MARYVAFLRAINVGGHTVAMARLREVFEAFGARDVSTIVASGNVIFDAGGRRTAAALELAIAAHLEEALGYAVPAFLRTPAEMARIAAHDPWAGTAVARATTFVCVLAEAPGAAARRAVAAASTAEDELAIDGRELYWRRHGAFSDSPLAKRGIEKATGMTMTVRNVTTMRKVAAALGA
jgi:uncharacterized protein (DUF1697 family)